MLAQVAFTILLFLAPCARGDLSSCFTENSTWISSDIIDTFQPVDDYNECQQLCTDHPNCSVFTWTSEENHHTKLFCFLFGVTGTKTTCEHCISGPSSCTCSTESACSAQEENIIDVVNGVIEEVDCQSLCSSNSSCSLYTWYDSTSFPSYTCILLTSCAERDNNCSGCFTGPPDCSVYTPTPGILIAGGGYGDASYSTEIFLPLSGQTCALADDMPGGQNGGTMSTVDDRAVYCLYHSCQQFSITGDSGAWTDYANTSMGRYRHSSWVSQAGLYLLGGAGSSSGTTTEIVPGGMSFTLQHNTELACSIPSDDSTSVILTGGWHTGTVVAKYDLQGFVELLPGLSEGRGYHACGTYHDGDHIVQVVAGGIDPDDGFKYLSSTEWLIAGVSQHWTTGHPLPRAMCCMAFSSTDNTMYILGGYDGDDYRDEIYSHAGGSDGEWKEAGRLMTKRGWGAATLLSVNSDSCK